MFKAKKQTPAKDAPGKGRRRLTRAERRKIDAAIRRAARTDKKELSAQDSIPYQRMWPDGVCRVTDTYYTKTVQFQDINYQLSQNEDKAAIFEGWCDFLNYFDSSIRFQFSFLNLAATRESYEKRIVIPPQGDDFDSIRAEYTEMLQNQLARGNNGLVKTKYRKAGYSPKFRSEHEADILLHQAAKQAFDQLNVKKLPKMKALQAEYAALLAEKKEAYAELRKARDEARELLTVKANVDRVLQDTGRGIAQEKEHSQR